MKVRILHIAAVKLLIIGSVFLSISCHRFPDGASGGEDPDTLHIPKLANFLDSVERARIIDEDTGIKRYTGIRAVPQDNDDFRRYDLDTVRWNEVSARNADFRGASFRSSKCESADFSGSDFRVSDMRWTLFDGSTMKNCRFDQAKMFHVHISYANLSGSTFLGTNMFGVEGHFAVLRDCDFSGALMKDTEFIRADFLRSKLIKVNLIRTVMKKCELDSTDCSFSDFTGAGLEESSFTGARLRHTNFQGAHLQNVDFSGADLTGCNFFGATFEHTNMNGCRNIPPEIKNLMDKEGYATGKWQDLKAK